MNRFERKKNVGLAIEALAKVRPLISESQFDKLHVVIAGGYDPRVTENVEHLKELQALAQKLDVTSKVTFLPNFTNEQRNWLFAKSTCLLYTPENEHYG